MTITLKRYIMPIIQVDSIETSAEVTPNALNVLQAIVN